jgi:hypothetical protein
VTRRNDKAVENAMVLPMRYKTVTSAPSRNAQARGTHQGSASRSNFSALRLGDLSLAQRRLGHDVADGEYAKYVSASVSVDRGMAQKVG